VAKYFTFCNILSFLFCAFAWALKGQPSNCSLKRDRDGIKVFTCKTENEKFKQLMAQFELENTTFQELKDFLWDAPNYTTWQYNMVESEIVSTKGDNELVYRSLIDAPWPVENRELVNAIKIVKEATVTRIFIHSVPYQKPPPDDVIRVPLFDAVWTITEVGTTLKATYLLRIDPGGSVPAWLANMTMIEGPSISFKELKKQILK